MFVRNDCKPLKCVPATPTGQTHLVNNIVFSPFKRQGFSYAERENFAEDDTSDH